MDQNLILEILNLVEATPPKDLHAGAITGDWINLAKNRRVGILLHAGPGLAAEPVTLTVNQAQDNAGTGSKALQFTTAWTKIAATDLSTTPQWTKVTQAVANTIQPTSNGSNDKMVYVEFRDSDLDVSNGFNHIQATVNSVATTAQLADVMYVVGEPRFGPSAPESVLTVLD